MVDPWVAYLAASMADLMAQLKVESMVGPKAASMAVPMAAWSVPLLVGSSAESWAGQTAELKAAESVA